MTKTYNVSIQHNEWGHLVCDYTTKKEAIKRASYIRTHGCFFTDDMKKDELTGVIVMVTTEQDNSAIYEQPLTKKYLSFRKK